MLRLSLALVLVLLLAGPAPAEDDDIPHRLMPFSVQDTNAARFAVREARRLLAQGRVEAALRIAQEVLDERPSDFYRVTSLPASTQWRLAAEEMRDLLAGLSSEDRRTYDRLSKPSTRPLMERAIRTRSAQELVSVAERFGASTAGHDATRLLSDLALEGGRPRAAAWWARSGLRYAPGDMGLWRRLIDALGAVGDGAAIAELEPPAALAAHWETWRARVPPAKPAPGWPMWAGRPTRAALAPIDGPQAESLRWTARTPLAHGALDRDPMRGGPGRGARKFDRYWQHFRPIHPAVDGRVAYVSDGRAVHALDLYSGVPRWTFDWETERSLPLLQPGSLSQGRTSFERAFAPVLTNDLVIATVEIAHDYERDTLQGVEISTYLPQRVLVALDRHTGSLVWWMGEHAEDALALEDVTVVSPCVVADGLVVAVASRYESFHHVFMLALDVRTGRRVWQESLAWGQQESNLFGSPVKELSASAPAVSGGTVYASTGLGFVAALDLHSGRPRWLASYEIQPMKPVDYWYTAPLRFPDIGPSPPVIRGDLLLVAPTDGQHLNAFDLASGKLRWRVAFGKPPEIGAPGHFLGVANDGKRDVALLTSNNLEAYDVADGELVWIGRMQDEYDERNVPVGRGAITAESVLVPTTNGLIRFSLQREGSFEGRTPWPRQVTPGNLLPLNQILLVTGRDSVQAFYSWDEIERDVARRRTARPDDPTVLLDAGEVYRMGGALERARHAFEQALALAERTENDEDRVAAARGLFRTWISAAIHHAISGPDEARAALREALTWAQNPAERVEARVRLDLLLDGRSKERAENLERLAEEAEGVRARFPGMEETVPARAMALLRLAQVHKNASRPHEAIAALQRLLQADGAVVIQGLPARRHARLLIDEITDVWGTEPYRRFEEEARRLLLDAERTGDDLLLDRILDEFPNATVVPAALLRLGKAHAQAGRPAEAAQVLRRLLSEHAEGDAAPEAAAMLAVAYGRAGLPGAASFARAWLAARHPDATIEIDGTPYTGRSFAEAHVEAPRLPLPSPSDALELPLMEQHFEAVDDEAWGRQIEVATEGDTQAPVALLSDGRTLIGFDLVNAKRAFRLETGPYHRALYSNGVLLLAAGRTIRAVTADTGTELWDVEIDGTVLDLEGSHGQAYALLYDAGGRRGLRRVLALDTARGRTVWELDLEGGADVREIRAHGPDVLLRELRHQDKRFWPALLVVDGLAGRMRHVIRLPAEGRTEGEITTVGRHLVVASRDDLGTHHATAYALDTGETAWTRELPGRGRTCAIVPDGGHVVLLQEDGHLGTYDLADGDTVTQTQIYAGSGSDASPFHGTQALVDDERLYLMPRASRPPWHVAAWSRTTGKLLWHTPWENPRAPGRSALALTQGGVVALTPYASNRQAVGADRPPTQVLLRVLDLATGEIRQEIEPVGLAPDYGLISMAQGWGAIVVFGKAGAGVYAAKR